MIQKFTFSVCAVLLCCSLAAAGTVTVTLDLTTAGQFKILAQDSTGDNAGIASYGFVLQGPVTGVDNATINTAAANGPGGIGSAGFTLLRSPDSDLTQVAGSQDTISGPNMIYGFGQTASSLSAKGITSFINPVEGDNWSVPAVIATGTYNAAQGKVSINQTAFDTFVNIFTSSTGKGVEGAQLSFVTVEIPEPATIGLLGLALVGGLGLRRR